MVELKHKCGGNIFFLFSLEKDDRKTSIYACTNCHRLWWDADINPLTQEKLDKYEG